MCGEGRGRVGEGGRRGSEGVSVREGERVRMRERGDGEGEGGRGRGG